MAPGVWQRAQHVHVVRGSCCSVCTRWRCHGVPGPTSERGGGHLPDDVGAFALLRTWSLQHELLLVRLQGDATRDGERFSRRVAACEPRATSIAHPIPVRTRGLRACANRCARFRLKMVRLNRSQAPGCACHATKILRSRTESRPSTTAAEARSPRHACANPPLPMRRSRT